MKGLQEAMSRKRPNVVLPTLAVLSLFSVPGHAIDPRIAPQKIIVCIEKPLDPSFVLARAEMIAGQIVASISIGIEWHGTGRSCPAAAGQAVPYEIRVLTDTRQDYFPGALGLCQPFDRIHGQVFYDRVRSAIEPDLMPYLLAYTLVHEITHLVQGTDWHSHAGVMKARWDGRDFGKMARMKLPFTDADLALIRRGLEGRKSTTSERRPMASSSVATQIGTDGAGDQ
jgi:hypothetical protein